MGYKRKRNEEDNRAITIDGDRIENRKWVQKSSGKYEINTIDEFKTKDFSNKTFCLFGLGDQEGYAEYFIDGVGMLAEVIIENGGTIIGNWSTEGYDYEESKGEINKVEGCTKTERVGVASVRKSSVNFFAPLYYALLRLALLCFSSLRFALLPSALL